MGLKEELTKLKDKIFGEQAPRSGIKVKNIKLESFTDEEKRLIAKILGFELPDSQTTNEDLERIRSVYLDNKVEAFLKWYFENMVKGQYTKIGEHRKVTDMRNLIEKMAVWYELRYPSYEVNRLLPGSSQERTNIDDVMFNSNSYVNSLVDEESDVRYLDWDKFYNAKSFIASLPWEERYIFEQPRYSEIVYADLRQSTAHLHLDFDGVVDMSEGFTSYTNSLVSDEELEGMYIKDILTLFQERGVVLSPNNELEQAVDNVDKWWHQQDEMLNAVMYRIIERGGNRIGPRRGFLFAKEFSRNIRIPMMYGVDYSDPGLRLFINEYIKAGGDLSLRCYIGYFSRTSDEEEFETVSIKKLLRTVSHNANTKYTPEENDLHQRLVNALASQINPDELKSAKVKSLRLLRKLQKSKESKK